MSIRSTDEKKQDSGSTPAAPSFNPQPQAAMQQPPQQPQQPAAPVMPAAAQPQSQPWKFGDMGMMGPISASLGSDSLMKLREKVTEVFKDVQSPELQIRVLALDTQQSNLGLYYSCVVLAMQMPKASNSGVAFYTMVLAGSREAPSNKTENILGQTYEITVTPGEAFDNVYVQRVTEAMRDAFPQSQLYNVGGTMVPADFNMDDTVAVHRLCYNASSAVFAELKMRQPDFQDINLAAARNDNNLQVSVNFSRDTIENAVGEPMRADVCVQFKTAHTSTNPNESLNNQARRNDSFGQVLGFIDPVWAPVQPQGNAWGMWQNPQMMMQASQKYAARFVITHMESNKVPTLPAYLLLLLSALPVGMNSTWFHAFYNQNRFDKSSKIDFTDVGALNIEANLPTPKHPAGNPNNRGDRLDTRAKDFTPEAFGNYMMRLFREGLYFSLDVPLAGPQTWYMEVFRAASEGNQEAIHAIVGACDQLTNGAFSQAFNQPGQARQIFVEQGNIIHMGYYEDSEGRKRDIRDIDHLAVLNVYGETDLNIVRQWSDSFLQTSRPLLQRLAERKNIIMAVTKNRAQITGMATRVTFAHNFLEALNRAAEMAGLHVKTSVPTTGLHAIDRGVASFVNQALVPANIGSVFYQAGSGPVGGMTNYQTRQFSRYGS